MRAIPFFILIIGFLSCFSCGKKKTDIVLDNQLKPEQVSDFPNSWKAGDTMSIYRYMENIAYKEKDSTIAIQMARRDAELGAYFFMEIGLRALPEMDASVYDKMKSDQKKICSQYNIWIFSMGCDASETGTIYTREMKRLLKQNKGLDFDVLFNPALAIL